MMKDNQIAVFYHFFEKDKIYKQNLIFFLSTAYSKDIDFYILCSSAIDFEIPHLDNISVINTPNKNFDFGAFSNFINQYLIREYNFYFFINSSVRGPFINQNNNSFWTDCFMRHIADDVHLVGSTIAIPEKNTPEVERFKGLFPNLNNRCSHVQSMAFCLSSTGYNHLMNLGFFDETEDKNKLDIICNYELRLSAEMIKNNWNIKCLLPEYNEIDYRKYEDSNMASILGDHDGPIDKGTYFGRTVSPYETIFAKINRGALSEIDLASYTFTMLTSSSARELNDWKERHDLLSDCKILILNSINKRKKRSNSILNRIKKKFFKNE